MTLPAASGLKQACLLVIDDQEANVLLLKRLLAADGFTNIVATTQSTEALILCKEHDPDLVLLDLQMPHPDGLEVMRRLNEGATETGQLPTPVLVLTADNTREAKRAALTLGASDFLTKPFDATETLLRIKNLLTTRLLQLELRNQNDTLEQRVHERTHQLEQARFEVAERLALAAEYRDDDTGEHIRRVGHLSALIAQQIGLPETQVELIRRAAPLHDLGKIAIPDTILLKAGKLTQLEFEAMKEHTTLGAKILSHSHSDLLQMSEQIALTHHERWDGSGYPNGLTGEQIPLVGRVASAADVFDALTHHRPYKNPWPTERALDEINRLSNHHFDPQIASALTTLPAPLLTTPTTHAPRTSHQRKGGRLSGVPARPST